MLAPPNFMGKCWCQLDGDLDVHSKVGKLLEDV